MAGILDIFWKDVLMYSEKWNSTVKKNSRFGACGKNEMLQLKKIF